MSPSSSHNSALLLGPKLREEKLDVYTVDVSSRTSLITKFHNANSPCTRRHVFDIEFHSFIPRMPSALRHFSVASVNALPDVRSDVGRVSPSFRVFAQMLVHPSIDPAFQAFFHLPPSVWRASMSIWVCVHAQMGVHIHSMSSSSWLPSGPLESGPGKSTGRRKSKLLRVPPNGARNQWLHDHHHPLTGTSSYFHRLTHWFNKGTSRPACALPLWKRCLGVILLTARFIYLGKHADRPDSRPRAP